MKTEHITAGIVALVFVIGIAFLAYSTAEPGQAMFGFKKPAIPKLPKPVIPKIDLTTKVDTILNGHTTLNMYAVLDGVYVGTSTTDEFGWSPLMFAEYEAPAETLYYMAAPRITSPASVGAKTYEAKFTRSPIKIMVAPATDLSGTKPVMIAEGLDAEGGKLEFEIIDKVITDTAVGSLGESDTETYVVNGNEFEVAIHAIATYVGGEKSVSFIVNGEITAYLFEAGVPITPNLPDGSQIKVNDIIEIEPDTYVIEFEIRAFKTDKILTIKDTSTGKTYKMTLADVGNIRVAKWTNKLSTKVNKLYYQEHEGTWEGRSTVLVVNNDYDTSAHWESSTRTGYDTDLTTTEKMYKRVGFTHKDKAVEGKISSCCSLINELDSSQPYFTATIAP